MKSKKSPLDYRFVMLSIGISVFWLVVIKFAFLEEPSSRMAVCQDFANKYLTSVRNENNSMHPSANPEEGINNMPAEKEKQSRWEKAVDVETDMYSLCVSDPSEAALKAYKSTVMSKYAASK
jgi:hypothetical protein